MVLLVLCTPFMCVVHATLFLLEPRLNHGVVSTVYTIHVCGTCNPLPLEPRLNHGVVSTVYTIHVCGACDPLSLESRLNHGVVSTVYTTNV